MCNEIYSRPIENKDLKFISEVYNFFILESTATYHIRVLSEKEIRDYFMLFDPRINGFIVSLGKEDAGFCLIKPYNKKKGGYFRTNEIIIYIKNQYQKKGIGKKPIEYLENIAKIKNIHVIIAGICTENISSIRLFEKSRYVKCGFFREFGYKFDRILDNVYYQKIF